MYGYTIFHEALMNNLIESVKSGSVSHAYIFEADKGMFALEAATLFASALTCLDKSVIPCGVCRSCVETKAYTNPDIIYVEPPKDKKSIDTQTIRAISEDAQKEPFNAPRKVYIIKNGDIMTPQAQNAFLKTFEEPPAYAVFIIIVENTDSLLQTIMSRGTLISFPPLKKEVVREYIQSKYPDCGNLEFLVNYCEGVPGACDEVMNNENFEELRTSSLKMLKLLLTPKKLDAFAVEKYINDNCADAGMIFDFWISYLRDILVFGCGIFDECINSDKADILRKFTQHFSAVHIVSALDTLTEGKEMLARYVKPSAAAIRCALKIKSKLLTI